MNNKLLTISILLSLIIYPLLAFSVFAETAFTQKPPKELYDEGVYYRERGEFDKAIEIFKQGTTNYPDYPTFYSQIGDIYRQQDKFEEAIPYLLKAIEKYSDIPMTPTEQFVSLHVALAHSYSGIGYKHYYSKEVCLREIYHVVKALEIDSNFSSKDLCMLVINSALRYLEAIEKGDKVTEAGGDGKEFILPEENIRLEDKLKYKAKAEQQFKDYQAGQLEILRKREETDERLRRRND